MKNLPDKEREPKLAFLMEKGSEKNYPLKLIRGMLNSVDIFEAIRDISKELQKKGKRGKNVPPYTEAAALARIVELMAYCKELDHYSVRNFVQADGIGDWTDDHTLLVQVMARLYRGDWASGQATLKSGTGYIISTHISLLDSIIDKAINEKKNSPEAGGVLQQDILRALESHPAIREYAARAFENATSIYVRKGHPTAESYFFDDFRNPEVEKTMQGLVQRGVLKVDPESKKYVNVTQFSDGFCGF